MLSLVLLVLFLCSEFLCRVLFAETVHGDRLKASAGTLWVRLASATCLVARVYFALAPVVEGKVLAAHFDNVVFFSFSFFLFFLFVELSRLSLLSLTPLTLFGDIGDRISKIDDHLR